MLWKFWKASERTARIFSLRTNISWLMFVVIVRTCPWIEAFANFVRQQIHFLPINRLQVKNTVWRSLLISCRFVCRFSRIERQWLRCWSARVLLLERTVRSCWKAFSACSRNFYKKIKQNKTKILLRNELVFVLSKLCLLSERVHHIDVDLKLRFLFVHSYHYDILVVEWLIVDEVFRFHFDTKFENYPKINIE